MKTYLITVLSFFFTLSVYAVPAEKPDNIGACIGVLTAAGNRGLTPDRVPENAVRLAQKYYPTIQTLSPKVSACTGTSLEISVSENCISKIPNKFDRDMYMAYFKNGVAVARTNFRGSGLNGAVLMLESFCSE